LDAANVEGGDIGRRGDQHRQGWGQNHKSRIPGRGAVGEHATNPATQNAHHPVDQTKAAAVGIGATMQLAMDVRLAAEGAKYGFVFARRGITPEACSSWFLPRLVGISTALDWCYSGRVFPASEAHERGLVRSLHTAEDLMPAARALAHTYLEASAPVSIALTRQLMWRGLTLDHPMDIHRADSRAIRARGNSADAKEGIASFLEKRDAKFPNTVSSDVPDVWPEWEEPTYR